MFRLIYEMRFGYESRFILLLFCRLWWRVVGWLLMIDCGWLYILSVCGFIVFGCQFGGNLAVEGGEFGFEGFQSLFLIIASYRSKCSASTLLTNDLIEHGEPFS